MQVILDEDVCLGLGCCQSVCPSVFKMVNMVARAQVGTVAPQDEDRCRDAAMECPTGAIRLRR